VKKSEYREKLACESSAWTASVSRACFVSRSTSDVARELVHRAVDLGLLLLDDLGDEGLGAAAEDVERLREEGLAQVARHRRLSLEARRVLRARRFEPRDEGVGDRRTLAVADERPPALARGATGSHQLAPPRPQQVVRHLREAAAEARKRPRARGAEAVSRVLDERRTRAPGLLVRFELEQRDGLLVLLARVGDRRVERDAEVREGGRACLTRRGLDRGAKLGEVVAH
jgi:hypothetical protein